MFLQVFLTFILLLEMICRFDNSSNDDLVKNCHFIVELSHRSRRIYRKYSRWIRRLIYRLPFGADFFPRSHSCDVQRLMPGMRRIAGKPVNDSIRQEADFSGFRGSTTALARATINRRTAVVSHTQTKTQKNFYSINCTSVIMREPARINPTVALRIRG